MQVVADDAAHHIAVFELRRERRILEFTARHLGGILFERHLVLMESVSRHHPTTHHPTQIELFDKVAACLIEQRGQPLLAEIRVRTHVGTIQPLAGRFVRGKESPRNHIVERVLAMFEVDVLSQRRAHGNWPTLIQRDMLPSGEDAQVTLEMRPSQQMRRIQRGITQPLYLFEDVDVFVRRVDDGELHSAPRVTSLRLRAHPSLLGAVRR